MLYLELEVNLLVRNVIEREIEREKVQMNPPFVTQAFEDSPKLSSNGLASYTKFSTSLRVCSSITCTKFNVQTRVGGYVSHSY